MFSNYYLIHHKTEKKRLDKKDKSGMLVNIITINMLVLSAISGFFFYDTTHNDDLTDLNKLTKLWFCLTFFFESTMKISMAQPNCQGVVNYLLLPIRKTKLYNTITLLDCLHLYNFLSFSFFAPYFVRLGIEDEITILQAIMCSFVVLFTSFLTTEIIKWARTLKARQITALLLIFLVLVSIIIYRLFSDNAFANTCQDFFSNVYVCLAIVAVEVFAIFKIGNVQLSRQLDLPSSNTRSIFSFNAFGMGNTYTKLLITMILRGKSMLVTLFLWPILGLVFLILGKVDVFPEGFDLTIYSYAMIFLGVNFVLNPLPTKLSVYFDGLFFRDKNCIKSLIDSYMVINFVVNTVYLIIILPIFKDFAVIPLYLLNILVMPFIYSLSITSNKCSRLDIFNPRSGMDNFSAIVMMIFILVVSITSQIPNRAPKVGLYMAVSAIFISLIFLIVRKVWVKKATDSFAENRYEILEILRTDKLNNYSDDADEESANEIFANEIINDLKN